MDVFKLRDYVVDEYKSYVESFVNIADERIDAYVQERLDSGELWPQAVLQLNPAYEPAERLDELVDAGILIPVPPSSSDRLLGFIGTSVRPWRQPSATNRTWLARARGRARASLTWCPSSTTSSRTPRTSRPCGRSSSTR